jgi:hypothetical protein
MYLRFLFICTTLLTLCACHQSYPVPKEQMEGEGEYAHLREQYLEMIHRSAPGTDWRQVNEQNMVAEYATQQNKADDPEFQSGTFANGKIKAQWMERGSNNQAGSVIALDYWPASNDIYAISDGGTLWRRNLDNNNWTDLNQNLRFKNRILQVIPLPNGGKRILTCIGKRVWYSDDEGQTFSSASGWNYYDDWGDPIQLVATDNGSTIELYYTVLTWNASPWGPRIQLYYSSDRGQTFSVIQTFAHGNSSRVSMWHPYGTGDCYLMNSSGSLLDLQGATVNTMTTTNNLPTGADCQLRGHRAANGNLTFYALIGRNKVYRSTNNGVSWQLRSNLPENAWTVGMEVSLSDANQVSFGEVNAYRSSDGGSTWNLVNEWWEYYGDVPNKLHADIMEIEFFRKSNNQEFALISNHGGLSVSYNYLQNNQNIGLSGLNVSQYYDVRTDPTDPNYLYAGSQDQGYQRASNAASNFGGVLDFTQIVSGDYGHMVFSANGTHLWKQYPGGDFGYHHNPKTSLSWSDSDWQLTGDNKPNVGWLVPTAELSNQPELNRILVGGGNINGGAGSYLIELTAANTAPYTITATQDNYNFRANSNNTESNISAIAVSALNGRRYVATEDGTFFRKNTNGSWQKATGFDGPNGFYLYGSHILPSKINPELVWFSGSGYSNAAVWKSTDGGQTFTAMSNGLPPTLVQEMAASPDEKFIFAATDAGPYVYSVEDNQWFSLHDGQVPLQNVYSVEYIAARRLVRFGTYGRGIWDFVLDDLATDAQVYRSACGSASGEIHLSTAGGQAPLVYQWSNSANGTTLTGLAAGAYTVTISDNNGITLTQTYQVTAGGKPEKPRLLTLSTGPCGQVNVQWAGPNNGAYQFRYKQENSAVWTVVGNIGSAKSRQITLDPSAGQAFSVSVRYVCAGGSESAWTTVSGVLQDCLSQDPVAMRNDDAPVAAPAPALRLYPNPSRGSTRLQVPGAADGNLSVQVYDMGGGLAHIQTLQLAAGEARLELGHLPPGMYWVAAEGYTPQKLMLSGQQ